MLCEIIEQHAVSHVGQSAARVSSLSGNSRCVLDFVLNRLFLLSRILQCLRIFGIRLRFRGGVSHLAVEE